MKTNTPVRKMFAIAAAALGLAANTFGAANYVYHERTGNDPRAMSGDHNCPLDMKYVDILNPTAAQAVTIRFKAEYQFETDRVRLYYTTDGSNPSGSFGVGAVGTLVIEATYECRFRSGPSDAFVDVAKAVIPAQPAGTTVKYIVSAWKDLAGDEIFANSGTCTGCGNFNNSSLATVFSYTTLPDADGDGVTDSLDNCPNIANADQSDVDGDLIGDVCDAERWWDVNGILAGAGGPTATGTWSAGDANWNPHSAGTSTTEGWPAGSHAIFSAGTDATDPFTVTLGSDQIAVAVTVDEGNVTVAGIDPVTTLTITSGNVAVTGSASGTLSNVVAGSSGITKSGTGTLALMGTNTYTGNTVVNAGVLSINNQGGDTLRALGAVPAAPTADSLTISNATVRFGAGVTTFPVNRGITLQGDGATIDMQTAGAIWFIPNVIEGAGTTLTKTGMAELGLYTAANKFAKLALDGGTLRVGQSTFPGIDESYGAVPVSLLPDAVTIRNGATNRTVGSATVTTHANRGFTMGSGGGVLRSDVQAMVINGPITGAGGLRKEGNRNLTLNGNNDFQGDLVLNGTQAASQTRAQIILNGYNNTPGNLIMNEGRLLLSNYNGWGSVSFTGGRIDANTNNCLGAGVVTIAPGAGQTNNLLLAQSTILSPTNVALPNDIVLTPGPTTIDISANAGRELILNGKVSGAANWIKNNSASAGNVVLANGANDFSGTATCVSGMFVATADGALGSTAGATIINDGASLALRGDVNYATPEPLQITGRGRLGTGALRSISGVNVFNGPVTMTNNSAIGVDAQQLTVSGAIGETTPSILTNVGAGLLILANGNTYSGGTIIRGNVRVANVSGSALGSGPVEIVAGGSLGGPGSFTGDLTVNGTLSPGASPGTTTTGSETWNPTGSYLWEINDVDAGAGSGWDVININGTLTITVPPGADGFDIDVTSLTLANVPGNVHDFSATTPYDWVLVTTTGGISGNVSDLDLDLSGFSNPVAGVFSLAIVGNNLVLHYEPAPVITGQPMSVAACEGTAAGFSVTAVGNSLTYQWYFNDAPIGGSTAASHAIPSVTVADGGNYHVAVSNAGGSVTSSVATLTVNLTTTATDPADQAVCEGANVMFATTAGGTGPHTYQWYKGGVAMGSETSATLALNNVSESDEAEYCVVVTGACNSATNCATLTVNPYPSASVNSTTICEGQSAMLTATTDAVGATYSWSPGGQTTPSITVSPTTTTIYTVTITKAGCSTNASGTVTVNPAPEVSVNSPSICEGSATLTATTDAANPSYLWSPGGQTTSSITVSPGVTTTYSVLVTDQTTGCTNTGVGTVHVGAVNTFVSTTPININDNTTANPYPSTINVSGLTATVCRVTVTLSNLGHAFPDDIDMVLVGPNGLGTLLMSDNGGGNLVSGVQLTFSDSAVATLPDSTQIVSGTYKPSNVGAKTDGSAFNDIFPAPAPLITYQTNLAIFNGINPNGEWKLFVVDDEFFDLGAIEDGWSLSISTAEPFTDIAVTVSDSPDPVGVGSNLTYTATVSNLGPSTALNVSLSDTLPAGVSFVSVSSSQGSCTESGGTVSCSLGSIDAGNAATVTIVVTPSAAGPLNNTISATTTTVEFLTGNNAEVETTTVRNPPVVTVAPANLTVCAGQPATFTATATGDGPFTYQWSHNGNPVGGATSSTLTIPNAQAADAGTYSVTVMNDVGNDSNSATLTVTPLPVVSVNSPTICVGQSAMLTPTHNAASPTYLWLPGGETTESITVSPAVTTVYTVWVRDGVTGCSNSAMSTVTVNQLTTASGATSVTNACPGSSVTFTTTAGGTGPFTYLWRKDGAEISGETSSSLTIASVTPASAGTYCVEVTGVCNTATNCATLTVAPPPTITAQPANQTTPMGNFATFTVGSTSVVASTIQWLENGSPISGATSSSLTVGPVTLADNGDQFQAVVSNCAGSTTSQVAVLTVTPVFGISYDFNTPGQFTNAPYFIQENEWLHGVNTGGSVVPQIGQTNAGGVGGSGALDIFGAQDMGIINPQAAFDFSLDGKVLTASTMLQVVAPTVNNRAAQLGFVVLTNSWQGQNAGAISDSVGQGFMSVILQSTAQPALTYQLRAQTKPTSGGPIEIVNPAPVQPEATLTAGNWYKLIARFQNMKGTVTDALAISGSLQDMGADGQTPGALVMSFDPTNVVSPTLVSQKAMFLALRENNVGCGVTVLDNLTAYNALVPLQFVQQPQEQTVLQGRRAILKALVDGEGPYTYRWFKNGTEIPGAGNWRYITPPVTATADYIVEVSNAGGSVLSDVATVSLQSDDLDVVSVGSVDGCTVGVNFDQPVDPATASNPANYLINGVAAVAAQVYTSSADLSQHRVVLTPATLLSGSFTVVVSSVKDLTGNAIDGITSGSGSVAGLVGVDINPSVASPQGQQYSFAPGQFEVTGGGSDIFSSPDSFRYVYTEKTGDFDVKMRVPYFDAVRQPSKAGFDVRASLDPGSPHALAAVNPIWPQRGLYEGTFRQQFNVAGTSWGNGSTFHQYPRWLRLRRVGNTFIRYSSLDGVTWTVQGQLTPTPPFPDNVLVGLAVCSVAQGVKATAQFEEYGDFGGYAGATSLSVSVAPLNPVFVAGNATNLTATATVTGATLPAGEVTYQWQRNTGSGWVNIPTTGTTNNIYNTGAQYVTDNGTQYRVVVNGSGLSATSDPVTVTVTDSTAPTLTAASIPANSAAQVIVVFSEPVSAATAVNPANYVVTNQAGANMGVASVVQNDSRTVVLTTVSSMPAGNYGVRVSNVQDLQGNTIAANSLRTFSQAITAPNLPVVIEFYMGIGGADSVALGNVTNNIRFTGRTPDSVVYSTTFGFNGNIGNFNNTGLDNFGARIYSYYVATNTGLYRFYIRSDDASALYMNTNAVNSTDPAGMVLLVARNGAQNAFGTAADQLAQNVPLVAGQRYYMEARLKEGGGGDGFGLAIQPQATTGTPANTVVVSGSVLQYPDSFAQPTPVLVDHFVGATSFATVTNEARWLNDTPDNLLFIGYNSVYSYNHGLGDSARNTYVGRLRSYFVAPSNGLYRFWFRVDDQAQLFMNTNAVNSTDPAGAKMLASQGAFNAAFVTSAQNIPLTGGQKYYTEIRFLEGGGGDGVHLVVKSQGDPATPAITEVAPGSLFEYPAALDRRYGPIRLAGITPAAPTVEDGRTVTFTAVGANGAGPAVYTWFKNGVLVAGNSTTYTTQPLGMSDNGAVITVLASNAFSSITRTATITVTADSTAPVLLSATGSQFGDTVTLLFSEPVEPISAQCLVNYSINGLSILGAIQDPSRTKVVLRTTPQTPGAVYTVTVNGVKDFSSTGNMVAANSTASFTAWELGGCNIFVEVFTGQGGGTVQDLLNFNKFQANTPDLTGWASTFSFGTSPQVGVPIANGVIPPPQLDNYGARLSALFDPPATGLYRFYVRGDDGTMLFMNTNGPSPAGKVMIARNDGANSGAYDNGTGGSASPILALDGDTLYYTEGLLKEGGGGDYVTVAFRRIDPGTLLPIGGLPPNTEIASGAYFRSFADTTGSSLVINEAPPADLNTFENDYVTLSVRAEILPNRLVKATCFTWEKLDLTSLEYVVVATGSNYSFYAALTDDGLPVRLTVGIPGTNVVYETTLHVAADGQPPLIASAQSLDGLTIDVCWSEKVDPVTAYGPDARFNYIINGQGPGDQIANVVGRHDQRFVTLFLTAPLAGNSFTIDALFINDQANPQNSGFTSASGRVRNFIARDIGAPPGPGYSFACDDNESIDVVAGGADIWGNSDIGHITLSPRLGNFDIWTRIQSLSRAIGDNDTISKAGIMVRENTNANSRTMHILVNPPISQPLVGRTDGGRDQGEAAQRIAPNNGTAQWPGTATWIPVQIPNGWVRFKRIDNTVTAFRSINGVDWTQVGVTTIPYGDVAYIGLATTAHVPAPSASTVFAEYRNIHIPDPPTILTQPSPDTQTVPAGTAVSYSVVASNPPNAGPLVYQWRRNDVKIPGQTNATLSITNPSASDSGSYVVWVGNDGGNTASTPVTLTVTGGGPTAGTDNVMANQNTPTSYPASTFLANDSSPNGPVSLVGVSGIAPASYTTDFNAGLPPGAAIFGTTTVETSGGVNNSGHIRLNTGVGNAAGSIVLPELTPGRRVTSFRAAFRLRIFDGSNQAADGFSFNFAPDVQLTANTGLGENGVGSGFSFCVDNYQFAPYPGGGTAQTSGMKIRYRGIDVAGLQTTTWMKPQFVPVEIIVTDKGILTVIVDGTNAFTNIQLPNYAFLPGRIGLYGRTGGEFQSHAIDDLSMTLVTTHETARLANYGGTLYQNATVAGGVLHLTDALNSQQGTFISDVLGSGTLTSMQADFQLRMGGGTARPADGFAFSVASDLPAGSFSEEGAGSYLTVTFDSWDNAGTDTAPSIEVKYGGIADANIVATQSLDGQREGGRPPHMSLFLSNGVPVTLAAPNFVPVSIHLDGDGTIDVSYKGNLIFDNLAIPGFVAGSNLRFGMGARTGGANDNHWIDNLGVTINTTGTPGTFTNDFSLPPIGTVVQTNGVVTYTPPANACGSDSFYYLVSDGLATSVGQVNVSIAETNPAPPVITQCVPSQTVGVNETCQGIMPDLRGQLLATDGCCCLTIDQTPAPGTSVGFGNTVVTFVVTDTGGLTASCQATITVADTNGPVIVCPSDITAECTNGAGTVVTYTTPTATDNCVPGSIPVTCSPPSGTAFPPGTNVVTCTAQDASNNVGACTFRVIIVDTMPPSLVCPPNVSVLTDEATCTATNVALGTPTAMDSCGGVTLGNNAPATYPVGVTTVIWTATDAQGNTAVCQQTVTVRDRRAPVITCPTNITVECGSSIALGVTGSATAIDDCDPSPVVTHSDTNTILVTSSSLNGWALSTTDGGVPPDTATAAFVSGPGTPILGTGSVRLAVGTNGSGAAQLRSTAYNGVALSSLAALQYSTYRTQDGTGEQMPYIILNVDVNGDGLVTDLLFFEPVYQRPAYNPSLPDQGATQTGVWQTWNALSGGWWSLNNLAGAGPGTGVKSLATYLAAFPNARLGTNATGAVRLVAGFGAGAWPNFDGNVDAVVVSTMSQNDAYDLELNPPGACAPTVIARFFRATDASGNVSVCPQFITQVDTTAPLLTCPGNITTGSDPGVCTAVVSYSATATDTCHPNPTVNCVPPSGSTFVAGPTTVTCTATDVCGNSTNCMFTVTVVPSAPSITSQPQSRTNSVGSTATFSVTASGAAPLTYQWYHGALPLLGQNASTLTLNNVQMTDAGDYTVVVSNACGLSVTSAVATLTVVVNISPLAVNDRIGAARNTVREIAAAELLANDSDPDGGTLSIISVTSPSTQGGTVSLSGSTITYTPPANFSAADKFNYTISDGQGGTATATVCVVVGGNNVVYIEPAGGWTYIYDGNSAAAGADNSGYTSLDGTWNHDNGSDAWARDGIGGILAANSNPPGGVNTMSGFLRIQDSGDPRNNGFPEVNAGGNAGSVGSNRKMYFGRNLTALGASGTLLNDGVTLTFRMRVPTSGMDDNYPGPAGVTNAYPAGGDGYFTHDGGKGNIGIRQGAGGIISFSLFTGFDTALLGPGLIMNHTAGTGPTSGNVDVGDNNVAITATNVVALDPTQWHEFWVTIVADTTGGGTHRVSIYRDGSSTPTVFHVTAGNGAEAQFGGTTSYLAIGTGSTGQSGAVDVDFFGFKSGVVAPNGPEQPQLSIVRQGANVVISWPQTCGNFVLESTGSLTAPVTWSPVGAPVTAVGDRFQVTVPATGNNFYRLVAQ